MTLRYFPTSESSTQKVTPKAIREWLVSLPQDFPASRFQLPENVKEKTTPGICGQRQSIPFAWYDQSTHSLRTSQASLLQDTCPEYSQTWPKQGMMQGGRCWVQTMWEPDTGVRDCGYWPTPNTMDCLKPKSEEALLREKTVTRVGRTQPANLRDCVSNMKKWATPSICGNYNRKGASKTSGDGLATQEQGQLNPSWVEWLVGIPIGWSSLDPITELIWLDWSVDPADVESEPRSYHTPRAIYGEHPGMTSETHLTEQAILAEEAKKIPTHGLIPRVATNIPNRVNRLKAIGNGQVPQCAATAWRILAGELI